MSLVSVLISWNWPWRRGILPCASSVSRSSQTFLRPSHVPASKPSSGKCPQPPEKKVHHNHSFFLMGAVQYLCPLLNTLETISCKLKAQTKKKELIRSSQKPQQKQSGFRFSLYIEKLPITKAHNVVNTVNPSFTSYQYEFIFPSWPAVFCTL